MHPISIYATGTYDFCRTVKFRLEFNREYEMMKARFVCFVR